ncbi:MAG: sigma-54 factor interaction domain-containing protein [Deltaproteobacteria bacterium]|nr:sigma-54 factor interaction domain-containing protein [Deltaproteobacteria bacterium]
MLLREGTVLGAVELELGRTRIRLVTDRDRALVALSPEGRFGELIGASAVMRAIYATLARAAPTTAPVLILGESGTGKELAAHSIHRASPRAAGPFEVVDCTALPATLAESILFGHEKGTFTGAHAASVGAFERAHGGTIFLDELGELPMELQAKLLRVLGEGEVRRLGATATRKVDVRVLAATNRDLRRESQRREGFGPTSTTASPWCRCGCPRCASASKTCPTSCPRCSSASRASGGSGRPPASTPRCSRRSRSTPGRATSASCATGWSSTPSCRCVPPSVRATTHPPSDSPAPRTTPSRTRGRPRSRRRRGPRSPRTCSPGSTTCRCVRPSASWSTASSAPTFGKMLSRTSAATSRRWRGARGSTGPRCFGRCGASASARG